LKVLHLDLTDDLSIKEIHRHRKARSKIWMSYNTKNVSQLKSMPI